ncbi:unnamed protein product [Camellia sinensis]
MIFANNINLCGPVTGKPCPGSPPFAPSPFVPPSTISSPSLGKYYAVCANVESQKTVIRKRNKSFIHLDHRLNLVGHVGFNSSTSWCQMQEKGDNGNDIGIANWTPSAKHETGWLQWEEKREYHSRLDINNRNAADMPKPDIVCVEKEEQGTKEKR